jgi:response regulator NasT
LSLRERVYSVLLVSASDSLNKSLAGLLPVSVYSPVTTVNSVSAAKRLTAERTFDFILVNSPLPDEDGMRFCVDAAFRGSSIVTIMVRTELYPDFFDRASGSGIFVVPKPLTKGTVTLALDWMVSARERLRLTEKKVLSVEEKMDEIRLVNRAKWLLISELHMSEPEAHRYIEKQAMDLCVRRRNVAEEIIKTYG